MNYKDQRGLVGKWKGFSVYVMEKKEYLDCWQKLDKNSICVIADDGMKIICEGQIIGILSPGGQVTETRPREYKVVVKREVQPQEDDSFSFGQYSTIVDDFFKHLQDPVIVE